MPEAHTAISHSDLLKRATATIAPRCKECNLPLRFLSREEEDKILREELLKWVGFRGLTPDEQEAAVKKVRPLRFGFYPFPYFFCPTHGHRLPEEVVFPRPPGALVVIENVAVPFNLERFVPPNIDEALEYYPSFYSFSKTKMSVQSYLCTLLNEIDKAHIEGTNSEEAFADYVHWLGGIEVLGEKIKRLAVAVGDTGPQVRSQ